MLPRTINLPRTFLSPHLVARMRPGPAFIPVQRSAITTAAAASNSPSSSEQNASQPGWTMTNAGSRREWQRADLHVVLVNPQIPQNAGNIARTCAATSIALHLVGPMGFEIDNTRLKRAGLDYWDWVACAVHPSWDEFYSFFNSLPGPKRLVGFSKLGKVHHATEGMYPPGTWLMFGAETTGLPPEVSLQIESLHKFWRNLIKIFCILPC